MRAGARWSAGPWVLALLAVLASGCSDDDTPASDPAAAHEFVEAWERSRTATFVATGTWERRSDETDAALRSDAYLAQDPPRRLQREQGGVQGRVGDRLLLCPAGAGDTTGSCSLGAPTGVSFDEAVTEEVLALESLVLGDDPLYEVTADGDCFDLTQQRADPRAPYGLRSRFCFDEASGAPTRRTVRFERGVVEEVVYDEIRSEVVAADLRP